ncbi:MAG: hypothetical protein QGH80_06745 [Acidimicrobiales bacterium]|nr:hypothetical protein [Acidimicrobiales bacterium]
MIKDSEVETLRSVTTSDNKVIHSFTKTPVGAGQTANNRPDNFITSSWDQFEHTL